MTSLINTDVRQVTYAKIYAALAALNIPAENAIQDATVASILISDFCREFYLDAMIHGASEERAAKAAQAVVDQAINAYCQVYTAVKNFGGSAMEAARAARAVVHQVSIVYLAVYVVVKITYASVEDATSTAASIAANHVTDAYLDIHRKFYEATNPFGTSPEDATGAAGVVADQLGNAYHKVYAASVAACTRPCDSTKAAGIPLLNAVNDARIAVRQLGEAYFIAYTSARNDGVSAEDAIKGAMPTIKTTVDEAIAAL